MPKKLGSHDNWRTPKEFFAVCDQEFHFGLDAAAAEANALCEKFLTKEMNALEWDWEYYLDAFPYCAVWCNPPYSLIGEFVKKAWEETQKSNITTCVLIPAYTDPKYWSNYVMQAHEIRFLKGRLSFLDEDGMKKTSARFPSVLVVNKWIKGQHYGKSPNQWVWDWRV